MPPISSSSFRVTVWDPLLIISQIICLQSSYYLTSSILISIFTFLMGQSITLNHVLGYTYLNGGNALGWVLGLCVLINAAVCTFSILNIVQRAKHVLDFTTTLHFLHLVITTIYSRHFPTSILWWICHIISLIMMAIGGEWLCIRREMQPIALANAESNGGRSTRGSGGTINNQKRINKKRPSDVLPMNPLWRENATLGQGESSNSRLLGGR